MLCSALTVACGFHCTQICHLEVTIIASGVSCFGGNRAPVAIQNFGSRFTILAIYLSFLTIQLSTSRTTMNQAS